MSTNARPQFQILLTAAALCAVLLVGTTSAFAAKGGHGGGTTTDSLSLVMVNDANGNGQPNSGDSVKFNVSSNAQDPTVRLACYQNGVLEYQGDRGVSPSWQIFTLSSLGWTSGAADCTATLLVYTNNGKPVELATLDFAVAA